ncbi:MAG: SMI1/KNR4 family protein [Sandaracinaceae bacterium]|nr:SMI1/KNR4 family protein [Sandaracinaceae bacterium]
MKELFDRFRQAQARLLATEDKDAAVLEAPGATRAQIEAVEANLQIQLPSGFRDFLAAFDTAGPGGELFCFRMLPLVTAPSWDAIVERIAGGSGVVAALLDEQQILPFADDYGGRHWYCLELSQADDEDCPVVELDLDCDLDDEDQIEILEVTESFAAFLEREMAACEREVAKRSGG